MKKIKMAWPGLNYATAKGVLILSPSTPLISPAPSGSPASGNLTAAQRNAVRSANSYLQLSGFSRQGLIDQLSSEFGDKYTVEQATYGATQAGIC